MLIVDWDIHHGQGVQYCFEDDPRWVFDKGEADVVCLRFKFCSLCLLFSFSQRALLLLAPLWASEILASSERFWLRHCWQRERGRIQYKCTMEQGQKYCTLMVSLWVFFPICFLLYLKPSSNLSTVSHNATVFTSTSEVMFVVVCTCMLFAFLIVCVQAVCVFYSFTEKTSSWYFRWAWKMVTICQSSVTFFCQLHMRWVIPKITLFLPKGKWSIKCLV